MCSDGTPRGRLGPARFGRDEPHPGKETPMITVILTHNVQDFDTWKEAFEAGQPLRSKHGIGIVSLHRGLQDRNQVTIVSEIASPQVLENFMADADQQAIMKNSGVIGAPTVLMTERVATTATAQPALR
jgi:hypothetical protein